MHWHGTEIPSPEAVRLAAKATVRTHEDGPCRQCPKDEDDTRCPQLRWAKVVLAQEIRP